MPFFSVLVEGSEINIDIGSDKASGFFVSRVVFAKSKAAASSAAIAAVSKEWTDGPHRQFGVCPRLIATETSQLSFLTGLLARRQGYVFHP